MQTFLEMCRTFGVENVRERAAKLRASCPAGLHDYFLFFTCGYDFIHAPSDTKFRGIMKVFIGPDGAIPLNLGNGCVASVRSTVGNPAMNTSIEGTSYANKPGQQVAFDPARMRKAAGVRDGGVGNYNLQTRALELTITHPEGLDSQGMLREDVVPKYKRAMENASTPSAITLGVLAEARTALAPYWSNVHSLGF